MDSSVASELMKVLACPNCRGPVELRDKDQLIVCTGECGYAYPIIDGIPHMVIDEARKPKAEK